jgi:phosphoenolpyruvate carboxylase
MTRVGGVPESEFSDERDERDSARLEMPHQLRADVRLLGELLGQVLTEYGGSDLLADVETLRHAVIAARSGDAEVRADEIARLVAGWSVARADSVARAFTVYFHLVNLAEEHQRIRILRDRDKGYAPLAESMAAAVDDLRATGGETALGAAIGGLEFHPVLTAHPTEARRRAVVGAIRRVSGALDRVNAPGAGASEVADARRRLLEEIDLLWRTAQLRSTKLDPLDEVRTAMTVFDETLFRVVPKVYRALDTAMSPTDAGRRAPLAPPFLRLGSWIGGDRDGNPNVTSRVTREAVGIQADHVLRALENAATRIGRALTVHTETTPASPKLAAALTAAGSAYPEPLAELAKRSPAEPHRQMLLFTAERLRATRLRDADLAYDGPDSFVADLRLVQDSLVEAGAPRQAYGELQHLVWQAETFGFHLAELEIRQHSEVHERALAEVRAGAELSEQSEEVLATLRVVAWIQARFGFAACHRYVVSFTRTSADMAAVFELAEAAVPDGPPVLDVVPLFETGDDLRASVDVLDDMMALPPVRERLAATGRRLEVMLGYSDSAKDLGPASATLLLFETQRRLGEWARTNDITLTLFHGRGGALGRGGGPANRAVLAQPPGSIEGRFKVTEQGEVISARYGQEAIAHRHIEQVASAVLRAGTPEVERRTADASARFRELAETVAEAARVAFQSLIGTEGFAGWFARISPLEEIGALRLGSRPSRRSAARGLEDLRAIPWVFAWTQTRVNLPGWYGLGTGLAAPGDLAALTQAYQEWPLFASLLDNAEMSLAKTDRGIAERYLALGDRPELTAQVLEEYDRTTELVLAVTGHDRLLADRRVLSRAVDLRNPYVDALSYLQLKALHGLRDGTVADDDERHRLDQLLLLTLNGVAAGLQNTG